MLDTLFDDGLNPRFISYSPVFRDELQPDGLLAPARLALHVTGAVDSFHARSVEDGDALEVVRDLHLEPLSPVTSTGVLRVDVWLERLDEATCTYGFLCSSDDGVTPYARGERTIVRVDSRQLRPATWSDAFLDRQASILKTLHNC